MRTEAKYLVAVLMITTLVICGHARAEESDCTADKAEYTRLLGPLMFHDGMTADDFRRYDATKEKSVRALSSFVTNLILERLNAGAGQKEIRAHIACVQKGGAPYDPGEWMRGATNTPILFVDRVDDSQIALSATVLMWGPLGIPQTKALIQCFVKRDGQWLIVRDLGDEFKGSTLEVRSIASPLEGQVWYLLSGKALGDSQSHQKLEIAACDGKTFDIKWHRAGLAQGTVNVSGNTVNITYTGKVGPNGEVVSATPAEKGKSRFREVLRVTPSGLERESRQAVPEEQ